MWNRPTKKMLDKIPALYAQEKVKDKKIYLKFFICSFTWYIAEFDHSDNDTMFGFVESPATYDMHNHGEWGYVSFRELLSIRSQGREVDREIHQVSPYAPKLLSVLLKEDGVI